MQGQYMPVVSCVCSCNISDLPRCYLFFLILLPFSPMPCKLYSVQVRPVCIFCDSFIRHRFSVHPFLFPSDLLSSLSEMPVVTRSLQSSRCTSRTQTVWICSLLPSARPPPRQSLTCWSGCRMLSDTIDNSILCIRACSQLCLHYVQGPFFSQLVFRFLRRKTLLQMLRADNLSLLEAAPKRWKSLESPSAEDNITGKTSMYNVDSLIMIDVSK